MKKLKNFIFCENKSIYSLDAPVSGGVGGQKMDLTFMVGGNKIAYEIMQPLFKVMAKNQFYADQQV